MTTSDARLQAAATIMAGMLANPNMEPVIRFDTLGEKAWMWLHDLESAAPAPYGNPGELSKWAEPTDGEWEKAWLSMFKTPTANPGLYWQGAKEISLRAYRLAAERGGGQPTF